MSFSLAGGRKEERNIGRKTGKCKKAKRYPDPQGENRGQGDIFSLAAEELPVHIEYRQDAKQEDQDVHKKEISSDDSCIGVEQCNRQSHGADNCEETPVEEGSDWRMAFDVFNYRDEQNREKQQL